MNDVAADAAFAIGNAFDGSNLTLGTASATNPLYILSHAALGCATSAALGTGCAGGAIGGATSAFLNPLIDSSGNIPTAAEVGITTLAGSVAAGLAGANAQAGANAAENETLNNWLNHVQTLQYLKAAANCPGSGCQQQAALSTISQQNNLSLAQACSGGTGSTSCQNQIAAAIEGGNTVFTLPQASGQYYTYANSLGLSSLGSDNFPRPTLVPTGTITSLDPSLAAVTLSNMTNSTFGGIFGGAAYYFTGSTTNAYYASGAGGRWMEY